MLSCTHKYRVTVNWMKLFHISIGRLEPPVYEYCVLCVMNGSQHHEQHKYGCVWACRPSLGEGNADTARLHCCVHPGKVTTTFCTPCCHLLANYNVQTRLRSDGSVSLRLNGATCLPLEARCSRLKSKSKTHRR